MANAKEIAAGVGQATDEELVELAKDSRATVSKAAKKEQDRRAAAAAEAEAAAAAEATPPEPPADEPGDTPADTPADDEPDDEVEVAEADKYDLIGADDRRILRGHSRSSCEETAARIKVATGEKLKIKPSS